MRNAHWIPCIVIAVIAILLPPTPATLTDWLNVASGAVFGAGIVGWMIGK